MDAERNVSGAVMFSATLYAGPDHREVLLEGTLGASERDLLATLLFDSVKSEPRKLVLDLRGIGYLDRHSARLIARCAERLQHRGGGLYVVASSRSVIKTLELSDVATPRPVFTTATAARRALGTPPGLLIEA